MRLGGWVPLNKLRHFYMSTYRLKYSHNILVSAIKLHGASTSCSYILLRLIYQWHLFDHRCKGNIGLFCETLKCLSLFEEGLPQTGLPPEEGGYKLDAEVTFKAPETLKIDFTLKN